METFIGRVIGQLQAQQTDWSKTKLVVPGKRASVFIREEFKAATLGASLMPDIVTIEDLVGELSGLLTIDNISLLFEFYDLYLQLNREEDQDNFDRFAKWAQIVLYDFNEIDRYCIDADRLFDNLSSIKRVEEWSPEQEATRMMSEYLDFWKQVEKYYQRLNEKLAAKGLAYQGMAFRRAAAEVAQRDLTKDDTQWIFIGFNALNAAEEQIIQRLLEAGRAQVYWDSDEYWLNNPKREAGLFLRRIRKWKHFKENPFEWVFDELRKKKEVHLLGVPKQVGQAKTVGRLLEQMHAGSQGKGLEKTAVVLADENLLLPVLNSLPACIPTVNVTMGYPLKNVPTSGFFEHYISMHANALKLKGREADAFYYKDVLNVLGHPCGRLLMKHEGEDHSQTLIQEVQKGNSVFLNANHFKKLPEGLKQRMECLFGEVLLSATELNQRALQLVELLQEGYKAEEGDTALDMEYLFRMAQLFRQLSIYLDKYDYIGEIRTYQGFYRQLLSAESLSFFGEPVRGLQLMGVLETRLLDFEQLIISSVNEGILPSGKSENSFIPLDIKNAFGLPTYREKDAVYAYHFYRLLQRAKKIKILYNTEEGHLGTGELSRFVTQLQYEFAQHWEIREDLVATVPKPFPKEQRRKDKSPAVLARIAEVFHEGAGLSPSALNMYLRNPMEFYYRRLMGMRELEEVEETIDYSTMGTVVHEVLEDLYKPLVKSILREDDINEMLWKCVELVKKKFEKEYSGGDYEHGKNLLIYKTSERFVQNFLKKELELIQAGHEVVVTHLEAELTHELNIPGFDRPVKLRGFVDRIDKVDGQVRIIDYKTGTVQPQDVSLKSVEEIRGDKAKEKAFQLIMYALLYKKRAEVPAGAEVVSGIISLRNSAQGLYELKINKDNLLGDAECQEFEELLVELLREIASPELPFVESETIYYDIL